MSAWRCPWCGARRSRPQGECPDSCGWSQSAHPAALAAVTIRGERFAASGANPTRAREFLGETLRVAGLDPAAAADAATIDVPDVGPWSFHEHGLPYVDVSRPGASVVDVVDMWDEFEFDWVKVSGTTEFLRLCRRWMVQWADRFERTGE